MDALKEQYGVSARIFRPQDLKRGANILPDRNSGLYGNGSFNEFRPTGPSNEKPLLFPQQAGKILRDKLRQFPDGTVGLFDHSPANQAQTRGVALFNSHQELDDPTVRGLHHLFSGTPIRPDAPLSSADYSAALAWKNQIFAMIKDHPQSAQSLDTKPVSPNVLGTFPRDIREAVGITSTDSLEVRCQKIILALRRAKDDPRFAQKLGTKPGIENYRTRAVYKNSRLQDDYPGFAMGGADYFRENQVAYVNHGKEGGIFFVIAEQKKPNGISSWKAHGFTGTGRVLGQEEIGQFTDLHVVKEHNRSYSQFSWKKEYGATVKEMPVQLFRMAFGLKHIPNEHSSLKYSFPAISELELAAIPRSR